MSERDDYADPEPLRRLPILWLFAVGAVCFIAGLYWLASQYLVE